LCQRFALDGDPRTLAAFAALARSPYFNTRSR
jgi:hypothetical protein